MLIRDTWPTVEDLFALTETPFERLFPYYKLVPKKPKDNARFRKKLVRLAAQDPEYAHELWIMCKRDFLFWLNAFGWTVDPREIKQPTLPFITYPFQDAIAKAMVDSLGKYDLLIEKSRTMGLTWLCVAIYAWMLLFYPNTMCLSLSRKEDFVDKRGDPKSIFWKLDEMLKLQPAFLLPNSASAIHRTHLHFGNTENGAVVDGETNTADSGRGDRRTLAVPDEFAFFPYSYEARASLGQIARSLWYVSTPNGPTGAFYDLREGGEVKVLTSHWTIHPIYKKGLYRATDDEISLIDKDYWTEHDPADYAFVPDGKLRSPWYDAECRRAASPREVARELDIDYGASNDPYFDPDTMRKLIESMPRHAVAEGMLDFDVESGHNPVFRDRRDGPLKLWIRPGANGRPDPSKQYVIGIDIASGSRIGGRGASNSVASVWCIDTSEKVAELVVHGVFPMDFAKRCYALTDWFTNHREQPFVIWEAAGPGLEFGPEFIRLGARNIFYRENERLLDPKATQSPGWWPSKESKEIVLGTYRNMLEREMVRNYSIKALRECMEYIYSNTSPVHAGSVRSMDASEGRANHGDRVIADALAVKILARKYDTAEKSEKLLVPNNSMGYRLLEWARERNAQDLDLEDGDTPYVDVLEILGGTGRPSGPVW